MKITTKYDLGDIVYHCKIDKSGTSSPCDLCDGTGRVRIVGASPSDNKVGCPRCHAAGTTTNDDYQWRPTTPVRLTVGMVRAEVTETFTDDDDDADNSCVTAVYRYMAHETGVGSGQVYDEDHLASSYTTSSTLAQARCDVLNAKEANR